MKNNLLFTLLFLFSPIILPAQTHWKTQTSSTVTFIIKNAGFNVDGSFQGLKADIKFDPKNLSASQITASIDAATINTGTNARDKHLRNEDYFYVEKYPKITMKSIRFANSKSGDYIGYFNLTIRDVTKEVTVPFKFEEKSGQAVFSGSFTINRRDFGVGSGSLILSNNATINLNIEVK